MERSEVHYFQTKSAFSALTANDVAVFESFKKNIDSKLRKTFPSIPVNFELKPVSVCRIQGCGTFYDFKVALPDGKFAKVSFNGNVGYVMGRKQSEPSEDSITIDPALASTAD